MTIDHADLLRPTYLPGLTQYVILHASAAKRPGVLAAQTAHAATECLRARVHPETTVVALVVETADELRILSAQLTAEGVHHVVIREPDEPYNGSATAIGIEPMEREKLRTLLGALKVLR